MNIYGITAFQANTGNLDVTGHGDTGLPMATGTSPSIDAYGNVAFQGSDGDVWVWDENDGGTDLGLGMMPGTSPAITPGVGWGAPEPSTRVIRGGRHNDRLKGDSRNDLIRGGRGNDLIRGRAGHDRGYGGPGKDRSYGGRGDDFLYGGAGTDSIYGGPGKDKIVDHRGATTVFAGAGNNVVDVDDGRGDDRVVCKPGTIADVFADRRDRIARSCLQRVPQPRNAR
jgi:Ca2+-binding RTX toxin-like protein